MAHAWYLASPGQDDIMAQARAETLGCAGFTRHVPPKYTGSLRSLPAVIVEAEPGEPCMLIHEPCVRADVNMALAAFQAGDDQAVARQANETAIRELAQAALTANRAYLAAVSPNATQNLAQIRALTRQQNGILRLLLGDLTGTD